MSVDYSVINNSTKIYALYDDNIVRKLDLSNMQVVLTIEPGNQKLTRVKTIEDQLIVGTSEGYIYIYETQFGSRLKLIKEHIADILSIVVSSDQQHIYVSGSDSKIIHISNIKINGSQSNYQVSSSDRGQSHDINSLVLISDEILLSAGNSTDVCVYSLDSNSSFPQRYFNTY